MSVEFDPVIKLFHVGGRGNTIGPADCLLEQLGSSVQLTVFEADPDLKDAGLQKGFALDGQFGKFLVMPRCLFDCVGKRKFYINADPDSSSLLRVSPKAKNYVHRQNLTWGESCSPARIIEIDVTTLDELHASEQLPVPDFISLDAQGAEYNILKGASRALLDNLLGVVTEVEFRQIYDGQKLFADQDALLRKHQFQLYELYNPQYWYTGDLTVGKGALVVAEALYLRDFRYFTHIKDRLGLRPLFLKLLKLILIASCFSRHSYAEEILSYVESRWLIDWDSFVEKNPYPYFDKFLPILRYNAPPSPLDAMNLPYDTRVIETRLLEQWQKK